MVGIQAEMQCFISFRFSCAQVQEGPLLYNFIYPRAVVNVGDPGSLILGRDRQLNKTTFYSAIKKPEAPMAKTGKIVEMD